MRNTLFMILFAAISAIIMGYGCGNTINSTRGLAAGRASATPFPTPVPLGGDGTWNSGCVVTGAQSGVATYGKIIRIFNGDSFTRSADYFGPEKSCADIALLMNIKIMGTYTPGDTVTTPEGFREIDYITASVTLLFNTTAAVTEANTGKYFGFSDWELGVAKDITGRKAPEVFGTDLKALSANEIRYDIIKINGATLNDGTLTDTDSSKGTLDGSTVAKRPIKASGIIYTKL